MSTRRAGPAIASASALLVTAVIVAAFGGLPGGHSSGESRSAPNVAPRYAAAAGTDECPTPEEIEAYWEKYGEDWKAAGTCGDPDPLPPADGAGGEEHSHAAAPPMPATEAEAQEMLDPTDDPLVLIHKGGDGQYEAVTIAVASGKEPPRSVRTVEEFRAWLRTEGEN